MAKYELYERLVSGRCDRGLYCDGALVATWDHTETEDRVWEQVAMRAGPDADVVVKSWEGPFPAEAPKPKPKAKPKAKPEP